MKKIFVSGCYDILHGGHIEFFNQAKSLGDYLIVSFASDEILWKHKGRKPSIPQQHKFNIISSLCMVDEVVVGDDMDKTGFEFEEHFARIRPDALVVTEDDTFESDKRALCEKYGAEYIVLPKSLNYETTSSSSIVNNIRAPRVSPLRVDLAGGWLDVPKHAVKDSYIVNCAIQPLVSLNEWQYEQNSGLGGSAAWAYLNGKDCVQSELDAGVGWQDSAIVKESCLCVWRSGDRPALELKTNPEFLNGRMAIMFTGKHHITTDILNIERDYDQIAIISRIARTGVEKRCIVVLSTAVNLSYIQQLDEGMDTLPSPPGSIARKYCGSGHGGYALFIFDSQKSRDTFADDNNAIKIEPYTNTY